ncbi:phosphotransferase, partial [bacterium]|nr:phosphotransferase [bacterium]
ADLSFLEVATVGGAEKYMLVEFPLNDIPRGYDRELRNLVNSGITPIIAHPERNALIMRKPAMIGQLIDIGALIQLNTGSLTGSFGRQTRMLAQNLLKRGWVHVIASDAHSANHRGPGLVSAVYAAEEVVGAVNARRLVQDNPEMIVEGVPWPKKESLMFSFGGV